MIEFNKLINDLHELKGSLELLEQFKKIACFIMNKVYINAGKQMYRIMECEFYYNSPSHEDPYVHGTDPKNKYARKKQCRTGEWYFHDSGSGLDITMGKENEMENETIYGGILIRGIYKLDKEINTPFVGPFTACRELFNRIGCIDNNILSIQFLDKILNDVEIINSTRIGIGLKLKEEDVDYEKKKFYKEKLYRFIAVEQAYICDKNFKNKVEVNKIINENLNINKCVF